MVSASAVKAALGIVGLKLDYTEANVAPPLPVVSYSLLERINSNTDSLGNTPADNTKRLKGLERAYFLGAPDVPEATISLRQFIDAFLRAIIAVFQARNMMHLAEILRRERDLDRILGDIANRISKFADDSQKQQDAINRFLAIMPGSSGSVGVSNVTASMFANDPNNLSFTAMTNAISADLPFHYGSGTTITDFLKEAYRRLVIDALREVEDPTDNSLDTNGVSSVDSLKQYVMDRLQVSSASGVTDTLLNQPQNAYLKPIWTAALTISNAWTNGTTDSNGTTGILDVVVNNAASWVDDLASGAQVGSLNLSTAGVSSTELNKLRLTSADLSTFISHLTTLNDLTGVANNNGVIAGGASYGTSAGTLTTDFSTINTNNTFGTSGDFGLAASVDTAIWAPGDSIAKNTYYYNSADGLFYKSTIGIDYVADKTDTTVIPAYSATTYGLGARVKTSDGKYYKANTAITATDVPGTSSKWDEIRVMETFNASHSYAPGEFVVTATGDVYQALGQVASGGIAPTNLTQYSSTNPTGRWGGFSYRDSGFFSLNSSYVAQLGLMARAASQAASRASVFFGTYKGAWSDSTAYAANDFVSLNGNYYTLNSAITIPSGITTGTAYAAGSVFNIGGTKYIVAPTKSITRNAWANGTSYATNDFVYDSASTYYYKKTSTAIPIFSLSNAYSSGGTFTVMSPTGNNAYTLKSGVSIVQTGTSYTDASATTVITRTKGDVVTYNGTKYIAVADSTYSGTSSSVAADLAAYFANTAKWQTYTSTDPATYTTFFQAPTAVSQFSSTYWQQTDTTGAQWFSSLVTAGNVEAYNSVISDFYTLSAAKAAGATRNPSEVSILASALKSAYQSTPSKVDVVTTSVESAYAQVIGAIASQTRSLVLMQNAINDSATDESLRVAIKRFMKDGLDPNKSVITVNNPSTPNAETSTTTLAQAIGALTSWSNVLDTDTTVPTGVIGAAMKTVISDISAMYSSSSGHINTSQAKKDQLSADVSSLIGAMNAGLQGASNALDRLQSRLNGYSDNLGSSTPGFITGTVINFAGSSQADAFEKLDALRQSFAAFTVPSNWSISSNYSAGDFVKYGSTYYKALVSNSGYIPNSTNSNIWQATDLNVIATMKMLDLQTAATDFNGSLSYRLNANDSRVTDVLTADEGVALQNAMLSAFQKETSTGLATGTITQLRVKNFIPEWSSSTAYTTGQIVQVTSPRETLYYQASQGSTGSTPASNPSKWTAITEATAKANAGSADLYYLYSLRQINAYSTQDSLRQINDYSTSTFWKDLRDLALVAADPQTVASGTTNNGLLKQLKTQYKLLADTINMPSEASRSVCSTNSNRLTYLDQASMNNYMSQFATIRDNMIGILNEINNTLTRTRFLTTDTTRWTSSLNVGSSDMVTLNVTNSVSNYGTTWTDSILTDSGTSSEFDNVKAGNGGVVKYFSPIADAASSIMSQLSGFQNFFYNAAQVNTSYSQGVRGTLKQFSTWGNLSGRFQAVYYDLYNSWGDFSSNFGGDSNFTVRRTGHVDGSLRGQSGLFGSVDATGDFGDLTDNMYNFAKAQFQTLNSDLDNWQRNYNDFHVAVVTQAELWVSRAYATTAPGEDVLFRARESDDISPEERKLMSKILSILVSILVAMLSSNIQVRAAVFNLINGTIMLDQLSRSLSIPVRLANNMIQRAAAVAADLIEQSKANKNSSAEFVASNPISAQTLYDLASFWQANKIDQKEVERAAAQQRRYM